MQQFEITNDLRKLISLSYIKNELNKERRRFLRYTYERNDHSEVMWFMYECMKSEMKAMTKEMRDLSKKTNVRTRWNSGGGIECIVAFEVVNGITQWRNLSIPCYDFHKYHEDVLVDEILLNT